MGSRRRTADPPLKTSAAPRTKCDVRGTLDFAPLGDRRLETNVPGHAIMVDTPEWLADQLLQAA